MVRKQYGFRVVGENYIGVETLHVTSRQELSVCRLSEPNPIAFAAVGFGSDRFRYYWSIVLKM